MYHLRVNGVLTTFVNLQQVWGEIDRNYQLLPDQYSDFINWRIVDDEGNRYAQEKQESGIWYACCEDSNAFFQWLRLFGWRPLNPKVDCYPS
jgi:hypothetical protein